MAQQNQINKRRVCHYDDQTEDQVCAIAAHIGMGAHNVRGKIVTKAVAMLYLSMVAEMKPSCHHCASPHVYTIQHEDEAEEDFCESCMSLFTRGSEADQYVILEQLATQD